MKIENPSCKQSQAQRKRSWKNQNVAISSDSVYGYLVCHSAKTRLSEAEVEVENQPQGLESSIVIGLFFYFCFWLQQCSFH